MQRCSGFHRASNFSPNRTPGRHLGINQTLPARRRLASLLAGLDSWVAEMGGNSVSTAFPGSAIGSRASVRRRFQSRCSFGCLAVGALVVGRPPGSTTSAGSLRKVCVRQRGFHKAAAVGAHCCCSPADYCGREWFLGAFGVALVSSLRVVSFSQCAQARGRAPTRAASMLSSGFHGFGVERRSGFHGRRSNLSLARPDAGRALRRQPNLPGRRRPASLLATRGRFR